MSHTAPNGGLFALWGVGELERFGQGGFAYFPDPSVVEEMQQARGRVVPNVDRGAFDLAGHDVDEDQKGDEGRGKDTRGVGLGR